jgi:NAD-dependent SIR2 family protein deacetylase
MAQAYCVKCKAKKEISDAKEVTMKNGRKAMKGKCPDCGTGMYRILGK